MPNARPSMKGTAGRPGFLPWKAKYDPLWGATVGAALVPLVSWFASADGQAPFGMMAATGGLAGLLVGFVLAFSHSLRIRELKRLYLHVDVIEETLRDTARDLEEQKSRSSQLSAALNTEENRLRDLLQAASDWFWEMDAGLRFTYVMERRGEAHRGPAAAALGKTPWEFACSDAEPIIWAEHRRDLEQRRPFRRMRYRVPQRDGTERVYEVSGTPVRDDRGVFVGYRGSATDVTDLCAAIPKAGHADGVLEAVSAATALFLRGHRWHVVIDDVLAKVGAALGANRVYACRNNSAAGDNRAFRMIHEWSANAGRPSVPDPDRPRWVFWREEGFERVRDCLSGNKLYAAASVDLSQAIRSGLGSWDARSILLVPVFVGEEWWGFLGFEDSLSDRSWHTVERGSLKAVATALAAAVARLEGAGSEYPPRVVSSRDGNGNGGRESRVIYDEGAVRRMSEAVARVMFGLSPAAPAGQQAELPFLKGEALADTERPARTA